MMDEVHGVLWVRAHYFLDTGNLASYNNLCTGETGRHYSGDHRETKGVQKGVNMGTIYKKGRHWYLNVRVKGKRIRKKIGPSRST